MGYNMERSRTVAPKLRRIVADKVASDPFEFNEGFLGKANVDYQMWIQNPDHWGGPIELFILAKCAPAPCIYLYRLLALHALLALQHASHVCAAQRTRSLRSPC